jgi:hypothetical protein
MPGIFVSRSAVTLAPSKPHAGSHNQIPRSAVGYPDGLRLDHAVYGSPCSRDSFLRRNDPRLILLNNGPVQRAIFLYPHSCPLARHGSARVIAAIKKSAEIVFYFIAVRQGSAP